MKKGLGIYVHIPFCVRKCAYCDFLSVKAGDEMQQLYVDQLVREITSYGEVARLYEAGTVFFGGGTPSLLTGEQMAAVFGALTEVFSFRDGAEISIEVNPGTVTGEKLTFYREIGFNRVSIGVQSVNDDELKGLGRIHTYRDFLDTYWLAREVGFDNVNVDLISAIPGQTKESWQKTLGTILALDPQPDHISAYSLIIEEGTPFYEMYAEPKADLAVLSLPGEEEERLIYQETKFCLEAAGYKRYEISNYSKPGYECCHNLGYWERREYLGLGLGASSLINNERFSNITDMEKYLIASEKVQERQALSQREQIEEFMFLGLRKMKGVEKREFFNQFGCKIEDWYEQELTDLFDKGLLVEQAGYIRLSERGIDLSNYVFAEFLCL